MPSSFIASSPCKETFALVFNVLSVTYWCPRGFAEECFLPGDQWILRYIFIVEVEKVKGIEYDSAFPVRMAERVKRRLAAAVQRYNLAIDNPVVIVSGEGDCCVGQTET